MAEVTSQKTEDASSLGDAVEETPENTELVLFQAKECYVYIIPPRKSSASYRADDWNVNKWSWEGTIKVVSKGEDCTIRLEDTATGELYAQAPVRGDQPHPLEAVIDSSRFFVLRIEDTSSGQSRHAFIGIGFRERPQAYDFQAALYDHVKYLNKKKEAEEMEQEYHSKPSADYSLKEGETLRLDLKTFTKSKFFDQHVEDTSRLHPLDVPKSDIPVRQPSDPNGTIPFLAPPPLPPPSIPSSTFMCLPSLNMKVVTTLDGAEVSTERVETTVDDDFGDFQAA
ncbi:hypothetical protein O6H91_01G055100 [Diphasiastrum complanatum]|uniref:Uncharacterized protein n=1 Tax=Diphasiastrum complanatum TaxID=34168 RepID=A0ACC2ERC1_DIPCM|nr:hypothetical protein O6H91_01G055100 [Diphasiastrum complanatum]